MPRVPEYLIVVRPDDPDLYRELQGRAAEEGGPRVILDRRRRDRRVIIRDVSQDRRQRDRRVPTPPAWDRRGFLLARTYRAVRPKGGNGFHNCLELPPAIALVR